MDEEVSGGLRLTEHCGAEEYLGRDEEGAGGGEIDGQVAKLIDQGQKRLMSPDSSQALGHH